MNRFMCCAAFLCVAASAEAIDVYHVGNSLTWDGSPSRVEDFAESRGYSHTHGHHIRCSWSLTRMLSDPTNTCVTPTAFGTFEPALSQSTWDAVTLQPHTNSGTTLKSETDAILSMISTAQSYAGNADTKFYIYAGWTTRNTLLSGWTTESDITDDTPMHRRRDVYEELYRRVTSATDAEVYMIPVGEIVYEIALAIEEGQFEDIDAFGELYRDDIHMSYGLGRYTAAAATFSTLYGDNLAGIGTSAFSAPTVEGVNQIVWEQIAGNTYTGVPEPASAFILTATTLFLVRRDFR